MTRIAFYAPMKAPDDPVPSGDRQMARGLIKALEHAGFEVSLISRFKSRDGKGDASRQQQILRQAKAEIEAVSAAEFDIWLTYHSYYKAPDLLGPTLSRAQGKPYVQIEATRARKRLSGRWARFAEAAEKACDVADVIFYLTAQDKETLEAYRPAHQRLIHLPPFLPRLALPEAARPEKHSIVLSAGMMRAGDKQESYRLIAETLPLLRTPGWKLDIAGDGPNRSSVEALFEETSERVRFLGELSPDALQSAYRDAALFFWPGVNEAFGMVYLEAQAAGLPVVAQNRPGVIDVLAEAAQPTVEDGPRALAARIESLMTNPHLRAAEGHAARAKVAADHLLASAAKRLSDALRPLAENAP
ncbi:glycosyltransferase family 4 protein [Thalassococcus sp. S3]|uniref:glycosyltransferase family 4 protein n=1 Tax=Thalassococcus sp. S3 TaxID=2017482 RepID=UPI0010248281|nr:glycosyltransferase family 4 protein [Thalassococcus sp. S3]QBF30670.1 glycosyl transferase family 1 [Thalassococcus sp. S3]